MVKYRIILEVEDKSTGNTETQIDDAIREGLETIGVEVLNSESFEKLK